MNTSPDELAPLRRETLGDQAYVALRDRLAAGELAPGEKLSLRSIAAALGVSVMPVREAVTRLVVDEALEVLPNRSIRVPETTLAKFLELTEVRKAVEGFAAERAASVANEEDVRTIQAHEAAFRTEAWAPDPDMRAVIRANRDFHFAVYAAAALPSLTTIIEGLWLRIGPVLNFDLRSSPDRLTRGTALDSHRRLTEAVAAREPNEARRALHDDIESAAAFIESTSMLPES